MNEKPWAEILREAIEDATPDTDIVRSYINELKLMKAMVDGTDAEIAEAEYNVHLDEGRVVH